MPARIVALPARKVGLPDELPAELAEASPAMRSRLEVPAPSPPDVRPPPSRLLARPRLPDLDRTDSS